MYRLKSLLTNQWLSRKIPLTTTTIVSAISGYYLGERLGNTSKRRHEMLTNINHKVLRQSLSDLIPRKAQALVDIEMITLDMVYSLVKIYALAGHKPNGEEITSFGSGFFINDNGLVITNSHVLLGTTRGIYVEQFVQDDDDDDNGEGSGQIHGSGYSYEAEVMFDDPYRDIAILYVHDFLFRPTSLEFDDGVQMGQPVISFGSLAELEFIISEGIISSVTHDGVYSVGTHQYQMIVKDQHQELAHTCPIYHGQSGGPLLNWSDYRSAYGVNWGSNMPWFETLAVRSSDVKEMVTEMWAKKRGRQYSFRRQLLGLVVKPYNQEIQFALSILLGKWDFGPMVYGGLIVCHILNTIETVDERPKNIYQLIQEFDVIYEVNGKAVNSVSDLNKLLDEDYDELVIKVRRDLDNIQLKAEPKLLLFNYSLI